MNRKKKFGLWIAGTLSAGVLAAVFVPSAFASIPDSSGVVHLCYDGVGNVRVIDSSTSSCLTGETELDIPTASGDSIVTSSDTLSPGITGTTEQIVELACPSGDTAVNGGVVSITQPAPPSGGSIEQQGVAYTTSGTEESSDGTYQLALPRPTNDNQDWRMQVTMDGAIELIPYTGSVQVPITVTYYVVCSS